MRFVFLIGGFVFSCEETIELLKRYGNLIRRLHSEKNKIWVVAGGGRTARTYIKLAKALGASNALLDEIGIMASRLNAYLLISCIGEIAHPIVPSSLDQVKALSDDRVVVVGGMFPGQSTDAVGSIIAEYFNVDYLFKFSGVKGVYRRYPPGPDEPILSRITYNELMKILSSKRFDPGTYELFDPVALRIISRSNIKLVFLDGKAPELLYQYLSGCAVGTEVVP